MNCAGHRVLRSSSWSVLAALALLFGGCDEGVYRLVVVSGASDGGDAVRFGAVDEVELVVTPRLADGQRFEALMPERQGDEAELRVAATGEWVLRLFRPYLDAYADADAERFVLTVPLSTAGGQDGVVDPPFVRVTFLQNGVRIAESASAELPWPLDASRSDPLFVPCRAFFAAECNASR